MVLYSLRCKFISINFVYRVYEWGFNTVCDTFGGLGSLNHSPSTTGLTLDVHSLFLAF